MKYINKLLPVLLISIFIVSCSYKTENKEQNNLQDNVSVTIKLDTTKYNRMINPTEEDLDIYHTELDYELTYYKNESGVTEDSKKKISLNYNDLENGFFIDGLTPENWFFELKGSKNYYIYCKGSTSQTLKFGNNTISLLLNDEYEGDEDHSKGELDVAVFTVANELTNIKFYLCKYDENSEEYDTYEEWLKSINISDTEQNSYYKTITFEQDSDDSIPDELKKMGLSDFAYKYYPENDYIDVDDHKIQLPAGIYFVKMSFWSYEYDNTHTNVVQTSEPVRIISGVTTTYNTINRLDVSRIEYNLDGGEWSDDDLLAIKENHYDVCVRTVTGNGHTYDNRKYLDLNPTIDGHDFLGWLCESGGTVEEDDNGYYITTQNICGTIKLKANWK